MNLRDGGTFRDAILVVGITGGLLGEGLNALIGTSPSGMWLGIAVLIAGLTLAALEIAYVNRPPYG